MRLTKLFIENYKGISKIDISNIPNFVVIVGENGAGKSSIFDAIAFTKNMISPYSVQDTNYWQSRMNIKNPIMAGKNNMKISLHIEPTTDEEKQSTGGEIAVAEISVSRDQNGKFLIDRNVTNNAQSLLNLWGRQEGFGGFEYIPANRTYHEGKLSLQSQQQNNEQFFGQRTSQLESKFNDVKQKFVNFKTHDAVRKNDPELFPEAQKLVSSLLGMNVDVDFDQNMFPRILVETKNGVVEIDSLSDGQRELFMTYVGIHATKLSNSVILFDEPDLHLHASMQKKALSYLKNFSNSGNQIFVTTHSMDMITETPEENLFHMSTSTDTTQLKNLEKEKEKLSIYKKLGASKYTYVNFHKIVFVEGESDYEILHRSSIDQSIRFNKIGGVTKIAPELLTEASEIESFFMIRDRDFTTADELQSQEQKYHYKIKFLKRRIIENYILDSDELFEIYQKYGNHEISTKKELVEKIKEIATEQFEQTLADYYVEKNNKNINFDQIKLKQNETANDGINHVFKLKQERLQSSIDTISEKLNGLRVELNGKWETDWIMYCNGKEILKKLGSTVFPQNRTFEELRDLVSISWDIKQKLPDDIDKILKEISVA